MANLKVVTLIGVVLLIFCLSAIALFVTFYHLYHPNENNDVRINISINIKGHEFLFN